jgi:hypothetical protein
LGGEYEMTAPETVLARLLTSMFRGGSAPMWKDACRGYEERNEERNEERRGRS